MPANRGFGLGLLVLAATLGGSAARGQAVRSEEGPFAGLTRVSERLAAPEALEPLASSEGLVTAKVADGWAAFRLGSEGDWQALVDRRTGLVSVVEGGGIAWIPGRGNRLAAGDVPALGRKDQVDLSVMESIAR